MRTLAAILLVCLAGAAQGATWRVEKDGSGDFTAILPHQTNLFLASAYEQIESMGSGEDSVVATYSIGTGYVVLHGHILDTPFEVTVMERSVWINGILVGPPPESTGSEDVSISEHILSRHRAQENADQALRLSYLQDGDYEAALNAFRRSLLEDERVVAVEETIDGLYVQFDDYGPQPKYIQFPPEGMLQQDQAERLEQEKERRERGLGRPAYGVIVRMLEQGRLVFLGYGYEVAIPLSESEGTLREVLDSQRGAPQSSGLLAECDQMVLRDIQSPRQLVRR